MVFGFRGPFPLSPGHLVLHCGLESSVRFGLLRFVAETTGPASRRRLVVSSGSEQRPSGGRHRRRVAVTLVSLLLGLGLSGCDFGNGEDIPSPSADLSADVVIIRDVNGGA